MIPFAVGVAAGIVIGIGLAIWGFASIPRRAAEMFNTPPKG